MVVGDRTTDSVELADALDESGVDVPEGSSVYAARVVETSAGLVYEEFEGGGRRPGRRAVAGVPTVVLAAEGALAYLAELGFSGAAAVTMAGETFTVADVYRSSSR